jgi:hypothetical protein
LAYKPDGTYRFVNRFTSGIEGASQDGPHFAASRGMSERLLVCILYEYLLTTRK